MTDMSRKTCRVGAVLATLALLWVTAAACFSGPAATTSDAPSTATSTADVASGSTVALTRPPAPTLAQTAPPAATEAPAAMTATSEPAVTSPAATPTTAPETATQDAESEAAAVSLAFADLYLLEERAFSYLSELAEDVGVRTSGTDLEREAAEYLVTRLEEFGYTTEVQEFSWDSPAAGLEIIGPEPGALDANVLTGTAEGQATAPLVLAGLAKPEDIPADGLEGKIALIERGEITFADKVSRVSDAGAVAAIIYNREGGNFLGTLRGRSSVPAIALSRADGLELKELLEAGETVEATVSVEGRAVRSRNVIAELPGTGDGVIVVGAHYDTVPGSVGASDNSSGVGTLLAVAERLEDSSFPFTLRFVSFGSEETGLHGSEHYVDTLSTEELEEIHLMINLDSIGSGDRLVVSGDRWAVGHVRDAAAREGIALDVSARGGGGSDHANFRRSWVPVVFFLSSDLSRINSPADTMEHINPRLLGDAAALTLDLLENVDTLAGYGQ